jgi:hypothetical protein
MFCTVLKIQQINFAGQLWTNRRHICHRPRSRSCGPREHSNRAGAERTRAFDQIDRASAKLFGPVEGHIVGNATIDVQSLPDFDGWKDARQAHRCDHRFNEVAVPVPINGTVRIEVGGHYRQVNGEVLEASGRQRAPPSALCSRNSVHSRTNSEGAMPLAIKVPFNAPIEHPRMKSGRTPNSVSAR